LYNLIAIAIRIAIAIHLIIAIFITTLATTIAVILVYLPITFHLLPLPFFVFAFAEAIVTSASALLV
jgi:hypothetical protein